MRITRYDPWQIIGQMSDILNPSVESRDNSNISTSHWVPAIDIRESKDAYTIEADLPGVDKDAIEISMDNSTLSIKGERKQETQEKSAYYSRTERTYGTFYRQFTLPDIADNENVSATYKDGVLKLDIAKKEAAKPKRINISSSEKSSTFLDNKHLDQQQDGSN